MVQGYRDIVVIPDKYNTGCKGELVSMADFFGSYYTEGEGFYITSSLQNALGTVYENIEFPMSISLNKTGLKSMTFRNCRFSTDGTYGVNTGNNFDSDNVKVLFENCEFLNQTSACVQPTKNFRFVNCKIHEMGSDGGKVLDKGSYENCYIYSIGTTDGAHSDGIQVTGDNTDFSIINCRFDVPSYVGHAANAAIFFILEGNSYNSTVKDCVMNGGNYTFYYGRKDVNSGVVIENNTVENILTGCSYQFGRLNDNSDSFDHSEVKEADKLFVSSVYKENGKIKLLATNYTNSEKTLKVVTEMESKDVVIPKCPTFDEGITNTSFEDFPFDVEIEVEGTDYVVCYDTSVSEENQIRYVNFSGGEFGGSTGPTIKDLFKRICDAIRTKEGSTDLIAHADIPQRILNLSVSAGDGAEDDEEDIEGGGDDEVIEEENTLPEQKYAYYGLFTGIDKDNADKTMYVYVTCAIQKSIAASAGVWKLTTGSGYFSMYKSYDKKSWELVQEATSASIALGLSSAYDYEYEGTILAE